MSYRGWARIREDMTRSDWCYHSRTWPGPDPEHPNNPCGAAEWFLGKYLPQACRNSHGPSNFKLATLVGGAWRDVCVEMNAADPAAVPYLNHWGSGWRNNGVSWQMEGLSFARNVVYITNLNDGGDKAYVLALNVTVKPADVLADFGLTELSYTLSPHLAQSFTVVTPFDTTSLPSFGQPKHDGQAFLFLMQDWRQRYFETKDLEFFPALPVSVSVIVGGLNVRSAPAGSVLRVAPQGEQMIVREYRPRGSFVWGRIGPNEWVALAAPSINGWYSTTWSMTTLPPPVS